MVFPGLPDALVSDTFSRFETLDYLAAKADKTTTYTRTEVDTKISNLINAAPTALDTLSEIASAINNDPNIATTLTSQLATKTDKTTIKQ